MSDGSSGNQGVGEGSSRVGDGKKCFKCGESGHFARECAEYWQARARGVPFVRTPYAPPAGRMGRSVVTTDENTRRSRSAEGGTVRTDMDDTNILMREYLVQKALERKARQEKEAEEEKKRKEEEARNEKERKKLLKQEERFRMEEERDARLLRIIRGEMKKDEDDYRARIRKGKSKTKLNKRGETIEEEKERLRRMIAMQGNIDEDTDDEELKLLRRRAAKLEISEKRKREMDKLVGNSPPMVTPEKRVSTRLTEESKKRIDVLKSASKQEAGCSDTRSLKKNVGNFMMLSLSTNLKRLANMFKNRRRKADLLKLDLTKLMKYYGAIKSFTTKRSKSKARSMISRVIKDVSGMSVRKRIIAKVQFDDRIKKSEVTRIVGKKCGELQLVKPMREMVKQRARIVWTRCPNVDDLIHNHRCFALRRAFNCVCCGTPFRRKDEHVHFRIGELDWVSAIVRNAKNVPRQDDERRGENLRKKLEETFRVWASELGRPCGEVSFSMEEIEGCFADETGRR
ncbi:hypothetical protein CBR_g8028 [Chara braunii]|uniref:CCHC-type domain-containing protein n=1 Tax=Chara braunii TaxID=69332 RepID=A0A388KL01_CHABU|nr:hypothetical protein CBR_g8028 [Chara braunii]|eukprot:GBG70730.1 hypothetical protein CBR_g8028 [Chara braunii]